MGLQSMPSFSRGRCGNPLRFSACVALLVAACWLASGSLQFALSKNRNVQAFQQARPHLGFTDSENLISTLALFFEKRVVTASAKDSLSNYRYVLDVGANIGRTTVTLINAHSDRVCREESMVVRNIKGCVEENRDAIFLSFEPMPETFDSLRNQSLRQGWERAQWVGVRAAVGSKTGQVQFFTTGRAGDTQASQDVSAALGPTNTVTVPLLSLDSLFYGEKPLPSDLLMAGSSTVARGLHQTPVNIFLLKVDAEGYDYDVLDGAARLLAAHRVKFLSFEYNNKWFTNGRKRKLKDVTVQLLDQYGYECFWITPAQLIPLSGDWWSEVYEYRSWSNVFCGISGDEDLTLVRDIYERVSKQ